MSLLKSEIDKFVKKDLGGFLKSYGYKYVPKAYGFVRYFDGGFNEVICAVIDYRPTYYLGFNFVTRIDDVERIRQMNGFFPEPYKKYTITVNTPLEYFNDVRRYEVLNEIDLIQVLDEVKRIYEEQIDSFMIKYSNVKNIDQASNVDKMRINILGSIEGMLSSIIIAKLAGNPAFEQLTEEYYSDFIKRNEEVKGMDSFIERVQKTIEYLRTV